MLLLFEGIDRSGKTAFAQNLSAQIGFPIYRKSVPTNLVWSEYHHYFQGIGYGLLELHNQFQFNAIIDRSFVSDWVYSNRANDTKPLGIWREWENRDVTRKVVVVYFHVPFPEFAKRLEEQPDPYMAVGDYDRFTALYEQYFEQCRFPVIRIPGHIPLWEQIALSKSEPLLRELVT